MKSPPLAQDRPEPKRDAGRPAQAPHAPGAAAAQRFRHQYSRLRTDGSVQQVCARGGVEARHTEVRARPSLFELAARCSQAAAAPGGAAMDAQARARACPDSLAPAADAPAETGDAGHSGHAAQPNIDDWIEALQECRQTAALGDAEAALRHPLFPQLTIRLYKEQGRCVLVLHSDCSTERHWLQRLQRQLAARLTSVWQRPVVCLTEAELT